MNGFAAVRKRAVVNVEIVRGVVFVITNQSRGWLSGSGGGTAGLAEFWEVTGKCPLLTDSPREKYLTASCLDANPGSCP